MVAGLAASAFILSSCEDQKPGAKAPAPAVAAPAAVPARYECPMSCAGSQGDKPGKCPTCGMELEKKS